MKGDVLIEENWFKLLNSISAYVSRRSLYCNSYYFLFIYLFFFFILFIFFFFCIFFVCVSL